ncbi:MAG: homoserine dehydrogenase [Cyanobacteria bacterium SIG28]|nr:homoserine dehydrogenase [Cyanobacteria bacterium SIG28]
MEKLRIGLIGLGTVGTGVYKSLKDFDNIEIVKIAVKNINKPRSIEISQNILTDNPYEIVNDSSIDVVVELIGGVEPAWSYIKTAIENGKHIVTANKELLAKKGEELFNLSEKHNRVVLYEAAIAGGIPIIMPIKTILAGNKISKIQAILNGTTNYILTKMDTDGASYEDVLKEAQALGYAETDPTGDVEGFDAAYKITTLGTIAFNSRIKFENVYREGITKIRKEDMKNANELGYKIKLIATATIDENNNSDVRVHPMLVSKKNMLAHIDYVTNAVAMSGHPIGDIVLSGPGAGEFPTASSVIGDILAIAREWKTTDYLLPMMRCHHHKISNPININDTYNKYYLSITAPNAIGVIAKIGTTCANKNVSLANIMQKCATDKNVAEITVITEKCLEKDIKEVIAELDNCQINSLLRVM